MKHEQRVRCDLYSRIEDGSLNFWVTSAERGFQCGDSILMREYSDERIADTTVERGFTGAFREFRVGFVHILSKTEVIIALLPILIAHSKKKN